MQNPYWIQADSESSERLVAGDMQASSVGLGGEGAGGGWVGKSRVRTRSLWYLVPVTPASLCVYHRSPTGCPTPPCCGSKSNSFTLSLKAPGYKQREIPHNLGASLNCLLLKPEDLP